MIMNVMTPGMSNLPLPPVSALLSGVPFTMSMPRSDSAAEPKKIQRQPTFCAINPPNKLQSPTRPTSPSTTS